MRASDVVSGDDAKPIGVQKPANNLIAAQTGGNLSVGDDIRHVHPLYRGVAQLAARLLWEQDAGSSSLSAPTNSFIGANYIKHKRER